MINRTRNYRRTTSPTAHCRGQRQRKKPNRSRHWRACRSHYSIVLSLTLVFSSVDCNPPSHPQPKTIEPAKRVYEREKNRRQYCQPKRVQKYRTRHSVGRGFATVSFKRQFHFVRIMFVAERIFILFLVNGRRSDRCYHYYYWVFTHVRKTTKYSHFVLYTVYTCQKCYARKPFNIVYELFQ